MLRVFANAKSKPGCADQLRPILQKLMKASRSETGVISYDIYESLDQRNFLFREEYAGLEEFEAHKKSRHVQLAVARSAFPMEGPLELWTVEPLSAERFSSDES
jgi:quinol monooxygenase YgiN